MTCRCRTPKIDETGLCLKCAGSMSKRVAFRSIEAADPNEDPDELYRQIRPLLTKMNLQNIIINNKTRLVMGQTQKTDSLYCVQIRRERQITSDTIERIKRNISNFNYMQWTDKAIEIYLWWPYKAPEEKTPGTGPA